MKTLLTIILVLGLASASSGETLKSTGDCFSFFDGYSCETQKWGCDFCGAKACVRWPSECPVLTLLHITSDFTLDERDGYLYIEVAGKTLRIDKDGKVEELQTQWLKLSRRP